MRSKMAACLSLVTLCGAVLAAAADTATGEWTGWIVDAKCGARNANANGKACTLMCFKNGSKLVLYTGTDQPLLGLDDQKLASENVGARVRVSGERTGDQLKVKAIKTAAAAAAGPAGSAPGGGRHQHGGHHQH